MNARLLLLLALFTGSLHASTLGISTSTDSYAYWETFTPVTVPPSTAVNIADLAPTSSDASSDFSATVSAVMSGSTPGEGDRIYSGTGQTGNAFNLTLDGIVNASIQTLTLQLKITGPLRGQGVTIESNIEPAGAHFTIAADQAWGSAEQTYFGYSTETAGTFYIYAWTWTGLELEASDTFTIDITSATGHVSLDAIRLDAGTVSAVPEPATYAAFAGFGVLALAVLRRRRA